MSSIRLSLIKLFQEKYTGKVVLEREQIRKTIYFRKGTPIFVESSIRSETLGQLLLTHEQITEEQYSKVLEAMKTSKRRQGEVIVELGILSGYEVFEAMKNQMASKIQNAFLLEGSKASLSQGDQELDGIPEFPIDFMRVLIESAELVEDRELVEVLPESKAIELSSEAREMLGNQTLKPFEIRAVRRLNGKFLLSEILEEASYEEDNVKNFLLTLESLGFLEIKAPPPKRFQIRVDEIPRYQKAEEKKKEKEVPKPDARKTIELELGEEKKKETPRPSKDSPIYAVALKLDHPIHQILDVQLSTPKFQIQKNYDLVLRKLHLQEPENHYEGKELELALRILDRLTMAYAVLSDDTRRKKYFDDFKERKETKISPELQAEVHFQKGLVAIRTNRYEQAIEDTRKAIEICPKETTYHISLSDFLLRKAATEKADPPGEIESHLKEALKLDRDQFLAWYHLGLLSKYLGDIERAIGCFQRVIEIKKNHPEASAELRILRKREEEKSGQSTLLGLFKKK